ncbi:MAG: MotA/TolQ/ExbB proton channel family protein [Polyangiales bacterium]
MKIVEKSKAVMLAMGAAPVMWLMIALSILSLAIILERGYFFYSIRDDLEALARELQNALNRGNIDEAKRRMEASPSAEAAVVVAGLVASDRGAAAAEEAMAGATALQRMKLERRLAYLGTLGNNAPFIGLFGTVVGIIQAFEKLGEAGKATAQASSVAAPAEVMASIAEALVATAIGLAVAIPAVAAYNYFQRLIKSTVMNTDALSRVLLAFLKSEPLEPATATAAAKPVVVAKKGNGEPKRTSKPPKEPAREESESEEKDD